MYLPHTETKHFKFFPGYILGMTVFIFSMCNIKGI